MRKSFKSLIGIVFIVAGVSGCHAPGTAPAVGYSAVRLPYSQQNAETRFVAPGPLTPTFSPEGRGDKNSASDSQAEGDEKGKGDEVPPVVLASQEIENIDCVPEVPCGQGTCLAMESLSPREVFLREGGEFFPTLGRDAKGLVNWHDMAMLGGSLAGSLVIREELDDEVRDFVRDHPQRWGNASENLGLLGEVQYQVPVLLGVYGYSVYSSNDELHQLSKALISAYTITGLSAVVVKGIADTERPSREWNDGKFGFPSFHTASSFSIASVVEEYEGLGTALPIYAMSGLIGWSRIDERDHDLSDVVFGAAMGYVIGKSVARQHRERNSHWRLMPYSHPVLPASGLAAEVRY